MPAPGKGRKGFGWDGAANPRVSGRDNGAEKEKSVESKKVLVGKRLLLLDERGVHRWGLHRTSVEVIFKGG